MMELKSKRRNKQPVLIKNHVIIEQYTDNEIVTRLDIIQLCFMGSCISSGRFTLFRRLSRKSPRVAIYLFLFRSSNDP